MEEQRALVFMADDNPANLRIIKNVLTEKYATATAPSAKKLFELLENNSPDMILLDVDMPEMDGYEAIEILKSKTETKDIPVIFLTGRTESDDELKGLTLGAIDYITKPIQPLLLLKRIEVHLLVEEQRKILEKQAAELKNFNNNLQKMVDDKTRDMLELQNAVLRTMAELVDYRDDITGKHSERTQRGIRIILEEIQRKGLYPEESKGWDIDMLVQCCQLHDIGKIFINDSILLKPGKLTEEEFDNMKTHTHIGEQIVEKIELLAKGNEFLAYAKIFAANHHEWWDGRGYPQGLKGKEIPLLGRVMAIADVYDSLVSERPYKDVFTHEEAVKMISDGSGTQFDPDLVKIFIIVAEQFRE
jgi:putative two-component system response regulator